MKIYILNYAHEEHDHNEHYAYQDREAAEFAFEELLGRIKEFSPIIEVISFRPNDMSFLTKNDGWGRLYITETTLY